MTNSAFRGLLDATKIDDITELLEEELTKDTVSWKPVGDRDNNLATINLGSDPAAGLIERVTNAIDAVLEREWQERGQPTGVHSPREAVEQWFGIKDGRLENVPDWSGKVGDLIQRVRVTMHDSDRPDRPTVEIRDSGIGLTAQQFSESILSLNANRKLRKFFLSGAFGQGGSTALAYSLYTIISSRAVDNGAGANPVAATIVRFNRGDIQVDKHGVYEYAVDASTGQPFVLEDVSLDEFPPGTLVRHLAMDLGKYNKLLTAPTNSLYYLAHHYLFDPVLPYRIEERRSNTSYDENRTVGGNHRRLTTGANTEHQLSARRNFRDGSIAITWWVLSQEGQSAQDRINNFCLRSKPIVITYNGQKQGELPSTIIKKDLKLPYLERYLVVHVDCDKLDNESRRQLFPTTREMLRDTSLLEDLRLTITETLQGDEKLSLLDQERKQRYVRRVDSQSLESIRRRLANRLEATPSPVDRAGCRLGQPAIRPSRHLHPGPL